MTTYESKTLVNQPKAKIFEQMADMRNLEKYAAAFPKNAAGDMKFAQDCIVATLPQFGQITIRLVEKENEEKLKFSLENFPIQANLFIKLDEIQAGKTQIQLILEADIPFFVRPMIEGKLKAGLDKAAEILSSALNK